MPRRRRSKPSRSAIPAVDRSRSGTHHPGEESTDWLASDGPAESRLRRLETRTCGWCGGPIAVKDRGRIPKWCSPSCRQRAWEQSRAAASGLSATHLVERTVKVPVPIQPTRKDWPRLLHELACQIDDGRIYDRDLNDLAVAIDAVVDAYRRRPWVRAFHRPVPPHRGRWPSQG
ncbi:conserved protein of unknown function [Modestobacter italicus]|uniref:Uncharacterized protein n=1 Tax=Modestobacter italicus (strain DSM 44449 / CECT 9708 / BC 501) TaxID=2732864 RepID=I4EX61_MODI5|nr:conserved protein of unknown function [Modestobacter marinus]